MARKTIEVSKLVAEANEFFKTYDPNNVSSDFVNGYRYMVERILHNSDNYKGFNYLFPNEIDSKFQAGINPEFIGKANRFIDKHGDTFENYHAGTTDQCFVNTDSNRIHFYI